MGNSPSKELHLLQHLSPTFEGVRAREVVKRLYLNTQEKML